MPQRQAESQFQPRVPNAACCSLLLYALPPPSFLILLLPPLPMTTLKKYEKKRTHTQLSLQTASTFSGHILRGNPSAYLPFCPSPFDIACLQTVREIVLSSFFILFYISFIFFLLLKSPAISASLFFTRTPLGVSSSGSLACCLSCHLAPAKLVYSLPAFSTSHPSLPSLSVSAASLIFFS